MSKLLFNTKYEFWFLKRRINIYKLQLSLLSPRGLEMINSMGKVMVVAYLYPASRIVIKPISCEYTSILDNKLLLRALRYDSYKCSLISEHHYVYIEACFIQI